MVAISNSFGSFNALLNLRRAQENETAALLRLSSGERLQEAADDPTDLAMANDLRSQIRTIQATRRTHFEGAAAIQLADDQIQELNNRLTRVTELATQAAQSVLGSDNAPAKQALDREYQELLLEIDQLNDSLDYNNVTLFGSSPASFVINADADPTGASEQILVAFSSFSTTVLGVNGTDLLTSANATAVLDAAVTAIDNLSRQRGRLGAVLARIEENMDNLEAYALNLEGQEIELRGTDIPTETAELARYQILSQSGLAVVAQTNLNADRVFQLVS